MILTHLFGFGLKSSMTRFFLCQVWESPVYRLNDMDIKSC